MSESKFIPYNQIGKQKKEPNFKPSKPAPSIVTIGGLFPYERNLCRDMRFGNSRYLQLDATDYAEIRKDD